MARSTVKLPDLSNATPGGIVDMCAPDQAEYNRLDKICKFLKTALKARLEPEHKVDPLTDVVYGEKFVAVLTMESKSGFSLAKAMELGYITQDQVNECTFKGNPYSVCRFYPVGTPNLPQKVEEGKGLQTPNLVPAPVPALPEEGLNDALEDLFQEEK